MPITEDELKRTVRAGNLAPVYFLYGEEPYLSAAYAGKIRRKAAPGDPTGDVLDEPAAAQPIYDAYMALSLGGGRRVVTVRDLHADTLPPAEFKAVLAMLADPNPDATLIFLFETVEIPLKKTPDRFQKLMAAVEKAGGAVVNFPRKSAAEAAAIAQAGAKKRGCALGPEAARHMVSVCGTGLYNLGNELGKLCAYVRPGGEITPETVDLLCPRTVEASVFALTDMLFEGNLGGALALVDDLLYSGTDPVEIVSRLAGFYVDLYRAGAAVKAGVAYRDAAARLDYGPRAFLLEKAGRALRRHTEEGVFLSLQAAAEADLTLKSSRREPEGVIWELLVELSYIGREGRRPC